MVLDDAACWRMVCARDGEGDGQFVYGVRTTGIYCRPSCGARRPRRGNVQFFRDVASARAAGLRACKRCAPDAARDDASMRLDWVRRVCAWLDQAPELSLAELAARVGYSVFHLQRTFRAVLGITPRQYAAERRRHRFAAALGAGASVTAATQRAGYGSASRAHAAASALGMAPSRLRAGGKGERLTWTIAPCALGRALVACSAAGLCALLLGDDDDALLADLRARFPHAELVGGDRAFAASLRSVLAIVDGAPLPSSLPFDLRGTVFQVRVWQELQRIPRGGTLDYATLAARVGAPRGARAVAAACAANPVAVLVPCHRVVRGDGALAGYRWGIERKRALLARERQA